MSNKTTATKTGVVSESSGVKATDNATEAVERGIPLNLPDNAVIGEFTFDSVSKGGQLKYVQDLRIPEEVLKVAPYLRGSTKPAIFNAYRGNAGIYLTGETFRAQGLDPEKGTLKSFTLVIIPK